MVKKVFAILLSALMIFPMLPGTALADPTVYTVTFDSQGGSPVDSIPAEEGATISAPEDPEKTGHTFAGWYKDSECTDDWVFDTDTVTGDITLYAKWTQNSYTVTFKDWDGTTLKEESVSHGGAATAPSDPTRTGYAFAGWDTAFDNITSPLIVTALYTANQYTVTFDAQGGAVTPESRAVTFGGAYGELPTPERAGFTFEGWYTEAGGAGSLMTAETVVDRAEDHTLYAKWTAGYRVSNAQELADALAAVQTGETIKLAADITYNSGIVISNKDITFDVGSYTLTVAPASGVAIDVVSEGVLNLIASGGQLNAVAINITAVHAYNGGTVEITNATSAGTPGSYGVAAVGAGSKITVSGNVTGSSGAYAHEGGIVIVDGIITSTSIYIVTVDHYDYRKENFTRPTTKEGYVTYTNGISKIWVKAQPCTVTFVKDGETYGTREVLESETINDENWPVDPTKDGVVFAGWFTGENGTGTRFTADTYVAGSISVYAKWGDIRLVGTPAELQAALAAAASGDTIKLTASFTYNSQIKYSGKEITFDVGAYTLTVGPTTGLHTIQMGSGGCLLLDDSGGGALNVIADNGAYGVVLNGANGIAEVSNIAVTGNYKYGVSTESGNTVTVRGNITVSGTNSCGVDTKGNVTVHGDITVSGANGTGVAAHGTGAHVMVGGDVTAYDGVYITMGDVTIDGSLTVANDYVRLIDIRKSKLDFTRPTTKDGYLTYSSGTMAVWIKAKPCTVTFGSAGATYDTKSVMEGETVGSGNWPADPVRDGYSFGGWYTGEYGAGIQFTENTTVIWDITVYARWIGGDYTVTLDVQGEGTVNPGSVSVTFGNPYGTIPTPVWAGHVFTGWYTQEGGLGTKITAASFVSVEADHTLFANWRDYDFTVGTAAELALALENTVTGDTIHLTSNITYTDPVVITEKDITIDVGAYTLSIQPDESSTPALEVGSGGTLQFDDSAGGILEAVTKWSGTDVNAAVYAHNGGIANVSAVRAISGSTGYGVYATGAGSSVIVSGNVYSQGFGVKAENGGEIIIFGDVEARGTRTTGVEAIGAGSQVTVLGSVLTEYLQSIGVKASGGTVAVFGLIVATSDQSIGVQTQGAGSEVFVLVGIQADGTGGLAVSADGGTVYAGFYIWAYDVVWARNGAEVTLDGISYVDNYFIRLGDPSIVVETPTVPTTMEGYDTYTDGISTVWDRILYVVTFDNEGDTESIEPLLVLPGDIYWELPEPTRAGYMFAGWYTQPDGGGVRVTADSALAVEADHTLYAYWLKADYTVKFDSKGGTPVPSIGVPKNYVLTAPDPEPTRSHYVFAGWYKDRYYKSAWRFGTDKVTKSITLYARWVTDTYTATIDPKNGAKPVSRKVVYGELVPPPAVIAPTRPHYIFGGWTTTGSNTWDFDIDTMPLKNITIYAKWIPNPHTVTFDANGGEFASPEPQVLQTAYYALIHPLLLPAREHYTFKGWYNAANGRMWSFTKDRMPDEDVILMAKWQPDAFAVSFNSQGGSKVSGKTGYWGLPLSAPISPKRTGYRFEGWYTDNVEYAHKWAFGTGGDAVTEKMTLFAKWIPLEFTVKFDERGGTLVPDATEVPYNTAIAMPETPENGDKVFGGWYTSSRYFTDKYKWNFNSKVTKSFTLYARWLPSGYKVTFSANGGKYAPGAVSTASAAYNGLIGEPETPPTKTGYTLEGWYTSSKYFTSAYKWDFSARRVTGSVTLYAHWLPERCTVTFSANGGAGAPAKATVDYGATVAEPGTPPTRTGYFFGGWYTSYKYFTDAYKWDFATRTVKSNVTLYARWVKTLSTPKVTAVATADDTIAVSCAAVQYATGYRFYYATTSSSSGQWTQVDSGTPSVSVEGLDAGKRYYFKAKAICAADVGTFASATSSAVSEVPGKPAFLTATATSYNKIHLEWGDVSRYTYFEVWRATSSKGRYSLVCAKPAGETAYDNAVNTGTTYYYKVRAYRLAGKAKVYGAYSTIVSARCVLGNAANLHVTGADATSVTLGWDAVPGVTRYEIWRATADTGVFKLLTTTSSISCTNTKLVTGQPYYYKVRAYRLIGRTKVYSGFTEAVVGTPGTTP